MISKTSPVVLSVNSIYLLTLKSPAFIERSGIKVGCIFFVSCLCSIILVKITAAMATFNIVQIYVIICIISN